MRDVPEEMNGFSTPAAGFVLAFEAAALPMWSEKWCAVESDRQAAAATLAKRTAELPLTESKCLQGHFILKLLRQAT